MDFHGFMVRSYGFITIIKNYKAVNTKTCMKCIYFLSLRFNFSRVLLQLKSNSKIKLSIKIELTTKKYGCRKTAKT